MARRNSFSLSSAANAINSGNDYYTSIPTADNHAIRPTEPQKRLTSYSMIPIIKPACSMPDGLAANAQHSNVNHANETNIEIIPLRDDGCNSNISSAVHSSQPNLMSSFGKINKQPVAMNCINSNYNTRYNSALPRRVPITNLEYRRNPYYYNELFNRPAAASENTENSQNDKAVIFDSNLNLLQESSESIDIPQKPARKFNGYNTNSCGDLLNNGNNSSAATLVEENELGPIPAARNLSNSNKSLKNPSNSHSSSSLNLLNSYSNNNASSNNNNQQNSTNAIA